MFLDDYQDIKQDIENGQLLALSWGGELVTVTEKQGDALVICCCAGRNVRRYMNHWYSWAKDQGCRLIRFHSSRPGLARIGRYYSFEKVGTDRHGQTIYECEVY